MALPLVNRIRTYLVGRIEAFILLSIIILLAGHSGKGVCVCRHVDVQLRVAQEVRQPKATVIVFKVYYLAQQQSYSLFFVYR